MSSTPTRDLQHPEDSRRSVASWLQTGGPRAPGASEEALIKTVRLPEVIEGAARNLEPHRLTFYLNELAGLFHSYYNKNKVVSEDGDLSGARLFLVRAVRTVLANVLRLLGVSAPERM